MASRSSKRGTSNFQPKMGSALLGHSEACRGCGRLLQALKSFGRSRLVLSETNSDFPMLSEAFLGSVKVKHRLCWAKNGLRCKALVAFGVHVVIM